MRSSLCCTCGINELLVSLALAFETLCFNAGGRVTKLGTDFIGMTVLGSINAAIGRQNIRADLRYKAHVRTCCLK